MSGGISVERGTSGSSTSLVILALRDTHGDRTNPKPRPVSIGALGAFDELRERARELGTEIVRYDDWDRTQEPHAILWDIATFAVLPRDLRKASSPSRRIAFCLESPLVAHRAYHRIGRISSEVAHLVLFGGAAALLPSSTRAEFHTLYWPNDELLPYQDEDPGNRGFLVMIASNKRSYRGWEGFDVRNPYRAARIAAARGLSASYRLRRRWYVPDLYKLRLQAITHFAQGEDFHLYGVGWDKHVQGERVNRSAIRRCYRGAVPDKRSVLQNFRFCLCFENTVFPGYITEKIFDCFFAGTIPVYLGPPDIERYIPTGCFIDARQFRSFAVLEEYLMSLREFEINAYRERILEFLGSDCFSPFTSSAFVTAILDVVDDVNKGTARSPRSWH